MFVLREWLLSGNQLPWSVFCRIVSRLKLNIGNFYTWEWDAVLCESLINITPLLNLSLVVRKRVFGVSDLGSTTTQDG